MSQCGAQVVVRRSKKEGAFMVVRLILIVSGLWRKPRETTNNK